MEGKHIEGETIQTKGKDEAVMANGRMLRERGKEMQSDDPINHSSREPQASLKS